MSKSDSAQNAIAIVGMALRFPGADDTEAFWKNLRNGVESVRFFSDEVLLTAGVCETDLSNPAYIKARAVLEGFEYFDASRFGYSPQEARLIDPQQRVFLECAWEALSQVDRPDDAEIGLFAGCGANTYLLRNLLPNQASLLSVVDEFQALIANDKDYLTTRVAYKLDLKGPVHTIQTACSTSLVAVHAACLSLQNGECDMALAGGVSIRLPQVTGYFYKEGMINSRDGHCRAYDEQASGTIGGSGAGVVLLKRLADAVADGDDIVAVVRGSATNNDGSLKAGFTAPSISGQKKVILKALDRASAHPDEVSYIEGHGTATVLGDPIEVSALTEAYRMHTKRKEYCALGSVKTNIGHLDAAAGIAGLIKAALCLKAAKLVPSLHFSSPNPKMDLGESPFFVNTEYRDWTPQFGRRFAGVSSFGIGGTNAHVILEEPTSASHNVKLSSARLPVLRAADRLHRERHWIDPPHPNAAEGQGLPAAGSAREKPVRVHPSTISWHSVGEIWGKHLGIDDVKPKDDYFELGGDSLSAVQIIEDINNTYHCNLSPGVLIEIPVLKEFALHLANVKSKQQDTHSEGLVIRLKSGVAPLAPIFVVHAAGGHVYSYRHMVDHMLNDRPVIGLQSPFIIMSLEDLPDMAALAEYLLKHIKEIQPSGPYHLLGSSFGGALSFAIAEKLLDQGDEIAFLGMIDTPGDAAVPQTTFTNDQFLAYHLSMNVGGERLVYQNELARLSPVEQITRWKAYLKKSGRHMPEIEDGKHLKILDIFRSNMFVLQNYKPPELDLLVHFFEANERDDLNVKQPHLFWHTKVGSMDITDVTGNHITMNEPPNVQLIAEVLDRVLGNVPDEDFVEIEL